MARPRQVTDEEILGVARRCALEHGPRVSLDVVAHGLGVSAPALLKRFGNRDALLLAALRPNDDPAWLRELAEGPDRRPLRQQLEELFTRVLDAFAADVPCMMALRESGIPFESVFEPGTTPLPVRGIRAVASWIERAREAGLVCGEESETAAAAMIGALQGHVFLPHICRRNFWRLSDHKFLEQLADLFTRALGPASIVTPAVRRLRRATPKATAASIPRAARATSTSSTPRTGRRKGRQGRR